VQLEVAQIASGLTNPVDLQQPNDGSGRFFIVEQGGRIRIIQNGAVLMTAFLDISGIPGFESGGEKGLLSLAFHPNYQLNRRFFVHYNRRVAGVLQGVLSEFTTSTGNPNVADAAEKVILVVPKTPTNADNHNGGTLVFGPDGFLYAGFGDGGGGGDVDNNAQNPDLLLGKLVRLDVDSAPPPGQNYVVPSTNPVRNRPAPADTIWMDGLRNPWRFSFERGGSNARMFLADVGQDRIEEVDIITGGNNYGWHIMEGSQCFNPPSTCPTAGLTLPTFEYDHSQGDESITGGFVYRGTRIPQLVGTYVFGDFISGRVWGLSQDAQGMWQRRDLFRLPAFGLSSFGQAQDGELYVVDYSSGTISRIRQVGTP
jgi:glucose/arabinose dehydrogenase